MNFSVPPISWSKRETSCGTKKEYCQELPSVKWNVTSCGAKGLTKPPFSFGRKKRVSVSNKFSKLPERCLYLSMSAANDLRYASSPGWAGFPLNDRILYSVDPMLIMHQSL